MRKFAVILVAALLAVGVLGVCGCGGSDRTDVETETDTYIYTGSYVNADNNAEYIELESNNTFTMMKDGEEISGSYDVEEGTLRLSAGSFSETMKISAGVITTEEGKKFMLVEEVRIDDSTEGSGTQKEAIEDYCREEDITIEGLTVSFEKEVSAQDPDWEIDYAFPAEAEGKGQFFLLHRVDGEWMVVAHTEGNQAGWTAAELQAVGAPADLAVQQ